MGTTMDPQSAVSALKAAGNDMGELKAAIGQAAFLMEKPGDARQQLRAAKTKLRKLMAEAEKSGAATTSSDKLVSPHIKSTYNASEFEALSQKYEKLSWRMISKPGGAAVKPDEFYKMYAFYKQTVEGDNTTERPMWAERGNLDFEGRARWDAWEAVKGMEKEKTKLAFVKLYYETSPSCLYKDSR